MTPQTVTRAAECDLEPSRIYTVLAEASNAPKWAPAFADAIEHIGGSNYRVTKSGASFNVEVTSNPSAVTVDFIREMPNGKRGGAYLRITPRPLGGSSITITVPIGPGTNESEAAKVLEQELADLIELARG
jgi:polyketide cyclase/dehydrase/lipid transport protein